MKNIVLLLTNLNDLNNQEADSFLIPVKGLSTRSLFELSLKEIAKIKNESSRTIYLLCDKMISQKDLPYLEESLKELKKYQTLIFFQDFSIYMEAKKLDMVDYLVFYSPTLMVNYQDLEIYRHLGIKHFIISKESTYNDYLSIIEHHQDVNLGMLCFAYPQIYYSKRKMITSFKQQFNLDFENKNLSIKEKTRDFYMPIFEDNEGTYIFAGEIFFPYKILAELNSKGIEMFVIDPSFVNWKENIPSLVKCALKGEKIQTNQVSDYLLYREMVNDYGK